MAKEVLDYVQSALLWMANGILIGWLIRDWQAPPLDYCGDDCPGHTTGLPGKSCLVPPRLRKLPADCPDGETVREHAAHGGKFF